MTALLVFAIILLYSFQTLFCTVFTKNYPGDSDHAGSVFCVYESLAIVLITLAFNGFRVSVSPLTLLIGVLNAAVLFGYNTSLVAASSRGSYAFMNLLMLFGGILVPTLYSTVFLHESVMILQWIAVAVMLVACALMNGGFHLKGAPVSYYLFCAALFFLNGMYGVFLKIQEQTNGAQSKEMVMITYLVMGVIAAVTFFTKQVKKKEKALAAFRLDGKSTLPLVLCILSAGIAINGLVKALTLVNPIVYFTVENGGVLLLAALYSVFLFREKTTPVKVVGMILAVVSITAMGMPAEYLPF